MSDLIVDNNGDLTSQIVKSTLKNILEGATGIATSEKKDLILSFSHVLQRVRGRSFLKAFLSEWNKFREKGRINDEYIYSEQHQVCLQELLECLDQDIPDETRFKVLKSILLIAATETVSQRDSVLPQEYMRLCRNLESGEILVLFAIDKIPFPKPNNFDFQKQEQWKRDIAQESGLVHQNLVLNYQEKLASKHLLCSGRITYCPMYSAVTDLGKSLVEYIKEYDSVENTL
ncbi:MAG: hypothetical protein AAF298_26605 [Cyanobacteria bacterium P01_A01_bin.40]